MVSYVRADARIRNSPKIDFILLGSAVLLIAFGLSSLYSQGVQHKDLAFFHKQLIYLVLGVIPFTIFFTIDPKRWISLVNVLYIINVIGLIAVLKIGTSLNGAERWINIGPFQFQPSEMAKIVTVLTLSTFYIARRDSITQFSTFILGGLHVLLPMILIVKQPHLGATMVIASIWFWITIIAGVPWKFILGATGIALFILIGAIISPKILPGFIHSYHEKRITAFLDGGSNQGSDYQTTRALIALGVGGVTGDGYAKGTQGDYIPEQPTDFVFTILGEELGLIGSSLLVLTYCVLFYRLWILCATTEDLYFRMIVTGILAIISFHTFVNLFMVTKLLPVIGLWLPFMSYGGTALWLCMSCIGLALNISRRIDDVRF